MTVVAIIPARGGSKGVPGKNLALVGGRSLVRRAVDSCHRARTIERVVVSTDDRLIALEAADAGALTVERPDELACDESTSESALLHALGELDVDASVVVFVQCTSPFIDPSDLDRAVAAVQSGNCDVAFAAAQFHGFVWRVTPDGHDGVNHDPSVRQRRQDRPEEFVETGAFYVVDAAGFLRAGHRFFGRARPIVVSAPPIEIDDPIDLETARLIAPQHGVPHAIDVRAVVTDFDGVHTDNRAYLDERGIESVVVNRADGMGISHLVAAGIPVLILSTERNPVVRARASKLGVDCIDACDDKVSAMLAWLRAREVDPADTLFIGNDVNDAGCLELVGVPVVVADAHPGVRHLAVATTCAVGGDGAVREIADAVLRSRSTVTHPHRHSSSHHPSSHHPSPHHPSPHHQHQEAIGS